MEFAYVVDILEMKGRSRWPSECHHALRGTAFRCFPGPDSSTDGEAWGLTWRIIQPIHRQRPNDFYPRGIHGNQKHGLLPVAWGMRICFPHKHAELAARIQDACQERRETDPHHPTPRPSDLFTDAVLGQESRSQQPTELFKTHIIRCLRAGLDQE